MDSKAVMGDSLLESAGTEVLLTVRRLAQSEFDGMEADWNDLVARSDENPVFMSWWWLNTWWQVFGDSGLSELRLLGAFNDKGSLVGLAPLYWQTFGTGLKRSRRVQLLGGRWRELDNVRSEYLGFVVDRTCVASVIPALVDHIESWSDWDELVICNHKYRSALRACLAEVVSKKGYLTRDLEYGEAFGLELDGDFAGYLAGLSSKSRLRLFNQRKKLANHGKIELRTPAEPREIHKALDLLDEFHNRRWGKPLLAGRRRRFHELVAVGLYERGMLNMSTLTVGGMEVSVLYDLRGVDAVYGFQLGFDDNFDKRISPSQLHIGYAIELAYADGFKVFDFLRGAGKSKASYKGKIASFSVPTSTIQIVRSKRLKWAYRLYLSTLGNRNRRRSGSHKGVPNDD